MKTEQCKVGGQILLIPQDNIIPNPNQPRENFDKGALESLAQSIRQNGIIQPITVRLTGEGFYEIISGERRLRAARLVGMKCVPCLLMEADNEKSALFALIENMQRNDLGFFEEARAIERLITVYGMNRDEVCRKLGKSASAVSNKLRILRLSPEIQHMITDASLTERHARALLSLSEEKIESVLDIVIKKELTVKETEDLIAKLTEKKHKSEKTPIKLFKDIKLFINTLNHAVDTMKRSGIDAQTVENETQDFIEYTVRIPKNGTCIISRHNETA